VSSENPTNDDQDWDNELSEYLDLYRNKEGASADSTDNPRQSAPLSQASSNIDAEISEPARVEQPADGQDKLADKASRPGEEKKHLNQPGEVQDQADAQAEVDAPTETALEADSEDLELETEAELNLDSKMSETDEASSDSLEPLGDDVISEVIEDTRSDEGPENFDIQVDDDPDSIAASADSELDDSSEPLLESSSIVELLEAADSAEMPSPDELPQLSVADAEALAAQSEYEQSEPGEESFEVEPIQGETVMADAIIEETRAVEAGLKVESSKSADSKKASTREKDRQKREKRRAKRLGRQRKKDQLGKFKKSSRRAKKKKEKNVGKDRHDKDRQRENARILKQRERDRKIRQKKSKEAEKRKEKAARKRGDRELNPLAARFKALQRKHASKVRTNIVGLDIGASTLRASLKQEGSESGLLITEHPLPPGIIVNGLLEEPEELTKEIKAFWKENSLDSKKVNFSFKNQSSLMKLKETAARDSTAIQQVIANDASRLISPFRPEHSILDYTALTPIGPRTRLQVGVANKSMAKKFARALERAGLIASACEIGPLAAARALNNPRYPRGGHIIVDIGAETTSVVLASGPDVFYMRIIDIGGNDFTEAIAESMNVNWDRAENYKLRIDLAGVANPDLREAQNRCQRIADQLAQELRRTIRQAVSETDRRAESVTWIGGGANMSGLLRRFDRVIPKMVPVTAEPSADLSYPDSERQATVAGLARGQAMSLLPAPDALSSNITIPGLRRKSQLDVEKSQKAGAKIAESQIGRHATNLKIVAILIVVVAAAGLNFSGGALNKSMKRLDKEQANIKAQISSIGEQAVPISYPNSASASKVAFALSRQPAGRSVADIVELLRRNGGRKIIVSTQGPDITARARVRSDISIAINEASIALPSIESVAITYSAPKQEIEVIAKTLPLITVTLPAEVSG